MPVEYLCKTHLVNTSLFYQSINPNVMLPPTKHQHGPERPRSKHPAIPTASPTTKQSSHPHRLSQLPKSLDALVPSPLPPPRPSASEQARAPKEAHRAASQPKHRSQWEALSFPFDNNPKGSGAQGDLQRSPSSAWKKARRVRFVLPGDSDGESGGNDHRGDVVLSRYLDKLPRSALARRKSNRTLSPPPMSA